MHRQAKQFFEFGPFRLDPSERTLWREDRPIPLPPKLFDTLCALVERSGHLVEKDEMLRLVWPDAFVEEGSLTRAVSRLRQVLASRDGDAPYIETIPKIGYRFVANVRVVREVEEDLILEEHVASRFSIEESGPSSDLVRTLDTAGALSAAPALASRTIEAAAPPRRPRRALLWAAAVLLPGLAALLVFRGTGKGPAPAAAAPRAVAVLPFRAVGPSISDGELGLEVADELSSRLGRLRQLAVRPAHGEEGSPGGNPLQAGRDLKADWVLEGTIREEPHRDTYSVRLLDVPSGRTRWARDFDAPPRDSLSAANTIAIGLSDALAPEITVRDRETLEEPRAERLDAYQLVMKGRLSMSRGGSRGTMAAGDYFQLAIEKDPHYSLAYSGLAGCYTSLFDGLVIDYAEAAPSARSNALKAVELDGTSAEAHLALGMVRALFDWDWVAAEREFRRAEELRPNYPSVHVARGYVASQLGRFDEALRELRMARELDPVSPWIPTLIGETLRRSGQSDQAVGELQRAASMSPAEGAPHYKLGMVYEGRGSYETAIAEFLRCLDAYGIKATAAAVRKANEEGGPMSAYRAWLERCELDRGVKAVRIAQIHLVLGEPARALDALELGFQQRSSEISGIGAEPTLAKLRSEPRFQELLRKMKAPAHTL
ncbi:MAG TPA: winged helix-turn-helix domain-containing protein [Thermoanaerobaculia bacterium]|nr:winged helix-turn-helix domain-containing protein [Thermoanaerobaculia bacterium]